MISKHVFQVWLPVWKACEKKHNTSLVGFFSKDKHIFSILKIESTLSADFNFSHFVCLTGLNLRIVKVFCYR